jgi:nucleoside-diphosphate-sugar epimerase
LGEARTLGKSLVIGGAGFIGAHLSRTLAEGGERVDILDNFSRGVSDPFLKEIAAKPGVRHVLERPYEVLRKNVEIHANAIALAKRQTTLDRFVFTSTSEVYAGSLLHTALPIPTPEDVPLALTDLANPRTSYMLSRSTGRRCVSSPASRSRSCALTMSTGRAWASYMSCRS